MSEKVADKHADDQAVPMTVVCEECGGTNIICQSDTRWCEEHQLFVAVDAIQESAFCSDCESEVEAFLEPIANLNRGKQPCQC